MFRYVVEPAPSAGHRRAYVLPLSIVTHLVLIAAALVVPLAAPSELPVAVRSVDVFVGDAPAPPPPPPPPIRRAAPHDSAANEKAAPIVAPEAITPERVTATTSDAVGIVESGLEGVPNGIAGSLITVAPPAPAAEPPIPTVHVGGKITPPQKIRDVAPVYPRLAVLSRVEGIVIIEATIGPLGNVLDARVLRSIPLLDAAALEAVGQWHYTPTLLNEAPVAVVMTVTVKFTLR